MSQWFGLGAVPVITGLVQVAKPWITTDDERWKPVMALAMGVAWNVGVALAMSASLPLAVVQGVVVGLAASGLYSADKTRRGG